MTRLPFAAVVVLSMLAACATPSTKRVVDITPEEAPRLMLTPADLERGDACTLSLDPTPALGELMDSAAVHAELERLQTEAGPVRGRALFTIRVDSTGAPAWIDISARSSNCRSRYGLRSPRSAERAAIRGRVGRDRAGASPPDVAGPAARTRRRTLSRSGVRLWPTVSDLTLLAVRV